MRRDSLQIVYGLLAITGLCLTWYWNLQFMRLHGGFSVTTFIGQNYLNPASASISNDLVVVAVTFLAWAFFEMRRLSMRFWWLYVLLTFGVALAFTFPLFLLMRERRIIVLTAPDPDVAASPELSR